MDYLIELTNKASAWPVGSRTRDVQKPVIAAKADARRKEIAQAEDLLNRQWSWLAAHEDEQHTERYGQKMAIFESTLADYMDLVDGLTIAETFLRDGAA